jgi:hypothetical protein
MCVQTYRQKPIYKGIADTYTRSLSTRRRISKSYISHPLFTSDKKHTPDPEKTKTTKVIKNKTAHQEIL